MTFSTNVVCLSSNDYLGYTVLVVGLSTGALLYLNTHQLLSR